MDLPKLLHSRSNRRCIQEQNELCTSPFFVLMLVICFSIVHSHNINSILPLWSFMWPVLDPKLRSVAVGVQGWPDMTLNPAIKFSTPAIRTLLRPKNNTFAMKSVSPCKVSCFVLKLVALMRSRRATGSAVPAREHNGWIPASVKRSDGQPTAPYATGQCWSSQVDISGLGLICLRALRQRLVNF